MYKVFGYDWDCIDFEFTFDSFVEAVKCFKKFDSWTVVFMNRGGDPTTCLYL